ncbi:MAG: transporter [Betaproteobacteria bacterium]
MQLVPASAHAVSWSLLAHVVTAHAAHPFITDDTRTQGTGKYELQLGAQYTRAPFDEVVISNLQFAPQLTYGVAPDVDAILRPTYIVNVLTGAVGGRAAGFGDTSVEFKWRIWSTDELSVGMSAGSGFASGNFDRGLDSGQSTPHAYLLFTAVLPSTELDVNVGTTRNVNDAAARQWLGHVSVLALWRVRDDLHLGADLAVDQSPLRSVSRMPVVLLLGAIAKASTDWDLDVGYQRGLNRSAPRNQVLLGATLRW